MVWSVAAHLDGDDDVGCAPDATAQPPSQPVMQCNDVCNASTLGVAAAAVVTQSHVARSASDTRSCGAAGTCATDAKSAATPSGGGGGGGGGSGSFAPAAAAACASTPLPVPHAEARLNPLPLISALASRGVSCAYEPQPGGRHAKVYVLNDADTVRAVGTQPLPECRGVSLVWELPDEALAHDNSVLEAAAVAAARRSVIK